MRLPSIHLRFGARDPYIWVALLTEFFGVALFQLLGSISNEPLQVALTFAAIMYFAKYISGGHLNPAVSLAALLSGHIDYIRGFLYITAQVLGGLAGAFVQAWLSPDSALGHTGPGCFAPSTDLSTWGLFGWETILTLLFIQVMYASIFVRPGHGDAAPLAAGLALFAALATGGNYTGFSPLNPARNLAASLVFKCFWRWTFVYISAQATASVLAAGWALLVYGKGDFFQHGTATEALRETLLGDSGSAEPAGPVHPTFAPTGFHYEGSLVTHQARQAAGVPSSAA